MRTWLQVETVLISHPKTRQLAKRWRCHPYMVAGFLLQLWSYCLEYQPDGNVDGRPMDVLDELAEPCLGALLGAHQTVRETLEEVGFVDPDGRLHDWDEYTGALVDRRAKDRERKRLEREAEAAERAEKRRRTSLGRPQDRPRTSRARVEKSRVEQSSVAAAAQPDARAPANPDAPIATAGFDLETLRSLDILQGNVRPEDFTAICGLVRGAQHPQAVIASLRGFGPGGIDEGVGVSWATVGQAVRELLAAGGGYSPLRLRAFIRGVLQRPPRAAGDPAMTDAERMRAARLRLAGEASA